MKDYEDMDSEEMLFELYRLRDLLRAGPEPKPTVENLQRRSKMFDDAYMRVRRAGANQLADGHASAGVECKIAIDEILGPLWERA